MAKKTFVQACQALTEKSYITEEINASEGDNVIVIDTGFSITFLEEFIRICRRYKKLLVINSLNYEGMELQLRSFDRLPR